MIAVPLANVPLAPLTTLRLGGAARWFLRARSVDDIRSGLSWAGERQLPLFVLGGGSNIVVSDDGWPGLVLHNALAGFGVTPDAGSSLVVAGAGEAWDSVVVRAVDAGLAGLECLSGIPGTVGGTPVQNVGAYGQEVSSVIDRVSVVDRRDGRAQELSGDDCGFAYRMSRFKRDDVDRFIVTAVAFRLRQDGPTIAYPDVITYLRQRAIMSPSLFDVREAVLAIRRRKGMVLDDADSDTRSAGSFFMNPIVPASVHASLADTMKTAVPAFAAGAGAVKIPAAWLIEHAGFARGFSEGAAAISSKHPLALSNRGGATAREVIQLAARIKRQVADRFGVALRTEPIFVGFGDDPDVAYLSSATL